MGHHRSHDRLYQPHLLPEALESWPVTLMERLLPRHMQIIFALNARVLAQTRQARGGGDRACRYFAHRREPWPRRPHGVARLRGRAQDQRRLGAAHRVDEADRIPQSQSHLPDRIVNKTNGVTPRRWLFEANPELTALLVEVLGDHILDDVEKLSAACPLGRRSAFQERFFAVKRARKERLRGRDRGTTGMKVDPRAMFDVQVKRIHEYKRQLLNILDTIALYDAIAPSRTRIGCRASRSLPARRPRARTAKPSSSSSTTSADKMNCDPAVRGLLKVVFLPNYNV